MSDIPLVDLHAQYTAIEDDIQEAISRVLTSQHFIGGPEVPAFEREFAAAQSTDFAVGCSNGTTAIAIALRALGVQPEDEVITPSMTFFATAEAIVDVGAIPVLVDIDPETLDIDPMGIEDAITPRTVGIVPVHLYGNPADMDEVMRVADRNDLWVMEDAAQAHLASYRGAMTGTIGVCGTFSFYPGKNLGAYGDAGAIVTSDESLAKLMQKIRDHGRAGKYEHDIYASNERMDDLQAAVLRAKLTHLEEWTAARRAAAARYDQMLSDMAVQPLKPTPGADPVWHLYPVLIDDRDRVLDEMRLAGIGVGIHYPIPVHLQPAHVERFGEKSLPISEDVASRLLSLPLYPEITSRAQEKVVEALQNAISAD
ncbi:MAG: DegT/DnrJ/EryC1/StrS family aminotransferase [Acidimicrobiia bacterium]|jgi:dTDP-4-amino-4,6-dideoxygalactose transaminase